MAEPMHDQQYLIQGFLRQHQLLPATGSDVTAVAMHLRPLHDGVNAILAEGIDWSAQDGSEALDFDRHLRPLVQQMRNELPPRELDVLAMPDPRPGETVDMKCQEMSGGAGILSSISIPVRGTLTRFHLIQMDWNWALAVSAQRERYLFIADTAVGTLLVLWGRLLQQKKLSGPDASGVLSRALRAVAELAKL